MVFPTKPGSSKRPHPEEIKVDDKINGKAPAANSTEQPQPKKKKVRDFNFDAHPKRKIVLQFLYHGWKYDGLVQQATTDNTVEKFLMDALLKTKLISDWKDCDFSRCGRTDKGVSAFKQVAALVVRSADTSGKFVFWPEDCCTTTRDSYPAKPELAYIRMLNGVLPPDISVTAWAPIPKDFSARHACNLRVYKYSMPRANLNVEAMQRGCDLLVGKHDFRNFCQIDMNEARVTMSYVREVYAVTTEVISRSGDTDSPYDLIELTVKGSGFLWHMIRFIVTVLHEIGLENEQPELINDLLDVEKTPSRPHYALAADSPLCLFDCRFDSHSLDWSYDDYAMKKTVAALQSSWAGFQTKARLVENMLNELIDSPIGSCVDKNKGLLEFTQDRALPVNYVPFAERKKCDSLAVKLEKLEKKQKVAQDVLASNGIA